VPFLFDRVVSLTLFVVQSLASVFKDFAGCWLLDLRILSVSFPPSPAIDITSAVVIAG